MKESEYHRIVAAWLRDSFSEIKHEPRLESGHRPDFVVYTPWNSYVLEVEETFEEIREGIGQSVEYASETGHIPVVVIPGEEVQYPEYEWLQASPYAPLIEAV